ncbi:MAG: PD-(D/E)XK nuclease family protein [Phycisphaerae bacterium]|jgi:hypothetical protein
MNAPVIPSRTLTEFGQLAQLIYELTLRSKERARATNARFNVFTTLLKSDDEVRLHTRFIHSLLDPVGLHDCGPLFLELFFQTLAEVGVLDHGGNPVPFDLPVAGRAWVVTKEASRGEAGQIDLLLECPGIAIAIENKVYAYEQPDQLARYGNYLSSRPNYATRVIYLTLDGKESATHGSQSYLRISYAVHILAWLEKCLRETYAIIPVNQALVQYRAVVRHLLGQTLDTSLMQDVKSFVRQHTGIIRHRSHMIQAIDAIRLDWVRSVADEAEKNLKADHELSFLHNKRCFDVGGNGAFALRPIAAGHILAGAPFRIVLQYWTEKRVFLVGAHAEKDEISLHRALFTAMEAWMANYAKVHDYHQAGANEEANWPLGWHDLLSLVEDIALADALEGVVTVSAERLCAGVREYGELVMQAYASARAAFPPSTLPSDAGPMGSLN